MIRTLIIEDEKTAADRLEKILQECDDSIEFVGNLQSIEEAVDWFMKNPQPDLIMLDIQLADGSSFEIFKKVRVESFIIFTTAYDEYAIKAFELNSVDYLLKPVNKEKLSKSLSKFKKLRAKDHTINIDSIIHAIQSHKSQYKKRFLVSIIDKIRSIETSEIAYFYSSEKSTFLCSKDSRSYPVEFSLDALELMLDPDQFFRINRQYLVCLESLGKIYILSKSRIKVELVPRTDETIYVSNARAHAFRRWLDK